MAWNYSTEQLQRLDAAHHLHPFTDGDQLGAKGVRIITDASGVFLHDSLGNEILDGMAGLWCVAIGYGREELAEAAARQMRQLPYYNTFFQTSHVPAIRLATRLAELAPGDLNHVFFSSSGSEANDTNIRLVRHYWAAKGQPEKQVIIARWNAYHGSTIGAASLGGMRGMHAQGGLPIPGIAHINQPDWWSEGGEMEATILRSGSLAFTTNATALLGILGVQASPATPTSTQFAGTWRYGAAMGGCISIFVENISISIPTTSRSRIATTQ